MATTSANNGWVESYLEALLSFGLSTEYQKAPSAEKSEKVDADAKTYAKYYVSQIMQLGEEGIYDAWSKATSARHYGEKDARLEYLSWRVWFMKRNRARIARAAAAERGRGALATDDAEGPGGGVLVDETEEEDDEMAAAAPVPEEAVPAQAVPEGPPGRPTKSVSFGATTTHEAPARPGAEPNLQVATQPRERSSLSFLSEYSSTPRTEDDGDARDPFEGRVDGLYMVLISLHGLVRGERMELGKDPDTGGQVKYVVELARALAQHPAVFRVDLLTRLIADPKVDKEYSQSEELLWRAEGEDGPGGAYITRLRCGPPEEYLRKEKLWPHIREFADRGVAHAKAQLHTLAEAGVPCELYAVHGHYADAGEVASLMASTLGVDMVMTGHSLGRNKLEHLLASGTVSRAEIEQTYAISRRIEGEERSLDCATMVLTSTQQEIDEQWGLYDGYEKNLEAVLRSRRRIGRHMPTMRVIPPGLDFTNLKVDLPEAPPVAGAPLAKGGASRVLSPRGGSGNERPGGRDSIDSSAPFSAVSGARSGPAEHRNGMTVTSRRASQTNGHCHRPPAPAPGPGSPPSPFSPFSQAASPFSSPTHRKRGSQDGAAPKADSVTSPRAAEPAAHGSFLTSFFEKEPKMWKEIFRFLKNPHKPTILAMSRPDAKKNITTLIQAFGEHPVLRELANLVLVMGNRDNIDGMAQGSQKILNQVLHMIDAYDLYGSVAYPKKHAQSDISDIYLLPFATRGVFTNVALQEPFGLTVIEAAAHGVPTVATKNGGPVDIMATLHHGLLVDPTNAPEIARALIRILTNPELWDRMSRAGVDNIMAYAWPEHCRKYLEALEYEKRFLRTHKKHQHRLSGSWDAKTFGINSGMGGGGANGAGSLLRGGSPQGRASMSRMASTPHADGDPFERAKAADAEALTLDGPHDEAHGSVRGAQRQRYAVVVVDGAFRVPALAPLLQSLAAQRGPGVGLGLASTMGFEDTSKALKAVGVELNEVDWIICNCGADIWHAGAERDGKAGPWAADEQWERHIDFRFERKPVASAVTKLVAGPDKTPGALQGSTTLLRALGGLEEQQTRGVHPQHIELDLDDSAKRMLDLGARARGKDAVATVVVDRIRKRMRQNGYRAHLTLQMRVEEDGGLAAVVHITPIRASRALALRFLAAKFGTDMAALSVVCLAPELAREGEVTRVATFTSDTIELVSGQCPVYLAAGGGPDTSRAARCDAAALERIAIKVSPRVFGDRIRCLDSPEELAKAVMADAKA